MAVRDSRASATRQARAGWADKFQLCLGSSAISYKLVTLVPILTVSAILPTASLIAAARLPNPRPASPLALRTKTVLRTHEEKAKMKHINVRSRTGSVA